MKPICFYHSADLDGKCSAAIVHLAFQGEVELYPINYGQPFPWELVQGRVVIMVDFSLQPYSDMERLARECAGLVWIDHHKTAIAEAVNRPINAQVLLVEGRAGCELAWQHFFPGRPTPWVVTLLGRYDVWDHRDPEVLPFQYGMRLGDWDPRSPAWEGLFGGQGRDAVLRETIDLGRDLLTYERQQNEAYISSRGFATSFEGHPAICCNRGLTNSKLFDSAYDPDEHDLMITFCRLPLPARRWTVSIYSTKPEIDCGELAKRHGGGGHRGAAGFQCDQLPFEI